MRTETGSINNPYSELVLIDAIERAQSLRRAIYVTIDGEPGIWRVFPDGGHQVVSTDRKVKRRRIVDVSGQNRFASSMVRKR